MVENAFYLVSAEIARRSGLINERYRTKNGRYVLDYKDLQRVTFIPEEYVSGLEGVEMITASQAKQEIIDGGYTMGEPVVEVPASETVSEEHTEVNENNEEQPANTDEQAEAGNPISEESDSETESESPAEENDNESNEQNNNEEE